MNNEKFNKFVKHNFDDLPDELQQRMFDLNNKLIPLIVEAVKHESPNIILASFGRIYAAFIKQFTVDDIDTQKKAATLYAQALIDEVERYNNMEKTK